MCVMLGILITHLFGVYFWYSYHSAGGWGVYALAAVAALKHVWVIWMRNACAHWCAVIGRDDEPHFSHTFIFPMNLVMTTLLQFQPTIVSGWGLMNYAVITIFHMISCDYKTASLA